MAFIPTNLLPLIWALTLIWSKRLYLKNSSTSLFVVCCLVAKSCPTLATPWTVARQALLSVGFSRQEYWSGLPFPFPGNLPDPGIKPMPPESSALAGGFFTTVPHRKPLVFLQFSSVQFSHSLFMTSWTAARQASVHHQLLGFTQTHIHWVSDAIQPSHPLSSPSSAVNLSQHHFSVKIYIWQYHLFLKTVGSDTVLGVAKSWTQLRNFTFTISFHSSVCFLTCWAWL